MNTEALYRSPNGTATVTQHGHGYTVHVGSSPPERYADYWSAVAAARRAAGLAVYRADQGEERRPRR